MAVSKVILNGTTLIDVTDKTVTSSAMLSGVTALSANGQVATGSISTKAAQTYTPGTTNQTIASNQYLNGAQTILGDANLVASNIAAGVSIFGVNGTHQGGSATVTQEVDGSLVLGQTGSATSIVPLSVTSNATYSAPANTAYNPVDVNVSGGGSTHTISVTKNISPYNFNLNIYYFDANTGQYTTLSSSSSDTTSSFSLNVYDNSFIFVRSVMTGYNCGISGVESSDIICNTLEGFIYSWLIKSNISTITCYCYGGGGSN